MMLWRATFEKSMINVRASLERLEREVWLPHTNDPHQNAGIAFGRREAWFCACILLGTAHGKKWRGPGK
jgi:hypothetical protein